MTAIGPSGGTATWTASYEASGNTACRAATSAATCAGTTPTGALLNWDNEGRLTAWQNITSATGSTPALEEALYDGEGQRVEQIDESNTTHTTTQHTYVGGTEDVASQWANTGGAVTTTTTAYYASGLAQSVNGALSYTLSDGLGSVSASVNASGTVTASQLYGPYGAARYQNGTLPTDYAFTHQRADATSGLNYYGARYYDPVAGQFTSADTMLPKSVAMPDPGQLNRYAYVGGNPETKTDSTGHCPWCIVGGALLGVVVATVSIEQAATAGNLNAGTFVRAGADIALGIGAGVALSADPVGGAIGLVGALAGVGIQTGVSHKFDYQSAFETVAAGTITGAVGGAAFDAVAGYGEASIAATGSVGKIVVQGAVQGGINATSDLSLQVLGHAHDLAAARQVNIDWGEVGWAGATGSVSGFMGGFVRHSGIRVPPPAMGGGASFVSSVATSAYAGNQQVSQPYNQSYGTGYRTGGRGIRW